MTYKNDQEKYFYMKHAVFYKPVAAQPPSQKNHQGEAGVSIIHLVFATNHIKDVGYVDRQTVEKGCFARLK